MKPLKSNLNKSLSKYEYRLNFSVYEYITEDIKKVLKSVSKTSQSSNSISIIFSLLSNPSAAWLLINTLQMTSFIPLSKNPLTPATTEFCKAISKTGLIPNLPELILDKNSSTVPFAQARKIGIETSVVFINIGTEITILLVTLGLYPIILIISLIQFKLISQKIQKIKDDYRYNFFIRFWIQIHLPIGIYSIINFESVIII